MPPPPPPSQPPPPPSLSREMLETLTDAGYPGLRHLVVNTPVTPALEAKIPDLVAQLAELAEKYPNTARDLELLGLFSGDTFPGGPYPQGGAPLGQTHFSQQVSPWKLILNTDRVVYPAVGEILDELSLSGHNPPYTEGIEGTLAHEFGHGWWNRTQRWAAASDSLRQAQDRFRENLYSLDAQDPNWRLLNQIDPSDAISRTLAKQISGYAGTGWLGDELHLTRGPNARLHEPVAELFRAQEYPHPIAQLANQNRPAWWAFSEFQDDAKKAGFKGSASIGTLNDIGLGLGTAVAANPLAKLVTQDKQKQGLIRGGLQGAAAGFGLTRSPLAALVGAGLGAASTLAPVDSLARELARSQGVG